MKDQGGPLEARALAALLQDEAGDHHVTDLAETCDVGYYAMRQVVTRFEERGLIIDLRQSTRGGRKGPAVVRLTVKGIGRALDEAV
jgi:DNA-binding MarR family transcriptional regulator